MNTKKIKEKYNLAPEWKVLTELASGLGINNLDQEKANLDLSLNKTIMWFLLDGAAGVLYLIKDNYGWIGLNQFYQFLNQYLDKPNQIGGVKLSDSLIRKSQFIKTESSRQDFSRILSNLQQELKDRDTGKEK
ncbi:MULTISPECIES: hypothetical protein [unclassified Lactobacillus]|uniref:hypothetical protein n=1 Tax=unclassified Lactobacillus TaxID=2620435 RepID=UPI000EFB9CBE|nr:MULTISPECIES: hypothetical protein [unclassified Lactobacillus]RMC26300.1 hypothetical protein F5ESL0247_00110 [Lactobacillus sp. ESL0247]RMC29838.1 hypothetical protein F5ESL0246_00110 [Lactobacillus sp. ESL0246]RMC34495.1 hypothetical protein F5ESL0245_00110 [Lactobacillus sp. ESL0245]